MEPKENVHTGKKSVQLVIIALFVLVAGGIGYYVSRQEKGFTKNALDFGEGDATTTIDVGGVTVVVPPGGDVQVEEVNANTIGVAPDINRKINFPSFYTRETQEIFLKKLQIIKEGLLRKPYSYSLWLDLGLSFKMVEDFEGAALAWEYAAKLSPSAPTAFGNLGFLYGYHLKNPTKAEENYKIALKNDPGELYLYEQLFGFYRDVLKSTAKARTFAEEGKRVTGDSKFFDNLLSTL